jgi:hypothetical protein
VEHPQQPEQPEPDPEPEPRPVFDGDWNSATGVQKGEHSERVRQWRKREDARAEAEAQRRMAAGLDQPVPRLPATDALSPDASAFDPATRQVLVDIRDNSQALASDRIRAAQTLIQLDRGAEHQGVHDSDLVQLRAVLETLDPHERLAWLQGERVDALRR